MACVAKDQEPEELSLEEQKEEAAKELALFLYDVWRESKGEKQLNLHELFS